MASMIRKPISLQAKRKKYFGLILDPSISLTYKSVIYELLSVCIQLSYLIICEIILQFRL